MHINSTSDNIYNIPHKNLVICKMYREEYADIIPLPDGRAQFVITRFKQRNKAWYHIINVFWLQQTHNHVLCRTLSRTALIAPPLIAEIGRAHV